MNSSVDTFHLFQRGVEVRTIPQRKIYTSPPYLQLKQLAVVLIRQLNATADKSSGARPSGIEPMVRADNVEIDRQLVATFDTVAQLPDGEPVRFRCSEWLDDVVLRDSARGILIEHRMPHLEIVPVGFEVY